MEPTTDYLKVFLSMFALNLPTFLVCGIACILIVGRWRQGSSYSGWAMAGFGVALLLCFVAPAVQTALQQWVFQSGERVSRVWVFTAFGFVLSILHAAIYTCLFAAVFSGRPSEEQG